MDRIDEQWQAHIMLNLLAAIIIAQPTASLIWTADAERPWPGEGDPGRCFVNATEHTLPESCDWLYWDAGDSYREDCTSTEPEFWCRANHSPIAGAWSYYARVTAVREVPAKQGMEHRAYPFATVKTDKPFVLTWVQAIRADFSRWPSTPGLYWATLMGLSSNPCCGAVQPSHTIGFDPNGLWVDGWERGPGATLPHNRPFRMTITSDYATYRLWVDGVLVAAGRWTANYGLRQFHPGLYCHGSIPDFESMMDSFALWALSAPWDSDTEPRLDIVAPPAPDPQPTPEPPLPIGPLPDVCVKLVPVECPSAQ